MSTLPDIDDISLFTAPNACHDLIRSLSRHEQSHHIIDDSQHFISSSSDVTVVAPVSIKYHHVLLFSSTLYCVEITNTLSDDDIIIRRVNVIMPQQSEFRLYIDRDNLPISLSPDDVGAILVSISSLRSTSFPSPLFSLTLEISSSSSLITHQIVLSNKGISPPAPISITFNCPSRVTNHSTFTISVMVNNLSGIEGDLSVIFDGGETGSESYSNNNDSPTLKAILNLDKMVPLGPISLGQSCAATLEFLALREGMARIDDVAVRSEASGDVYRQQKPLYILVVPYGCSDFSH
eukprot:CRZ02157.1 hypothetical protein [Spongospora subterranea]